MNARKVFFWAWFWFILIITLVWVISTSTFFWFISNLKPINGSEPFTIDYRLLIIIDLVLPALLIMHVLENMIIIQPHLNYLYVWKGKVLDPLTPGMYFPFRHFNYLTQDYKVDMRQFEVKFLIGSREGVPEKITDYYQFGSHFNMFSKSGSSFRFIFSVSMKYVDIKQMVYGTTDYLDHITKKIEQKVKTYIQSRSSIEIINQFAAEDWDIRILDEIRNNIRRDVGTELVSFTPIAIMTDQNIENSMLSVELEMRKGDVLKAELNNMDFKKSIADKNDEIRNNEIKSLQNTLNVDGDKAINYLSEREKWKAFQELSKNGNIVFVNDLISKNLNKR